MRAITLLLASGSVLATLIGCGKPPATQLPSAVVEAWEQAGGLLVEPVSPSPHCTASRPVELIPRIKVATWHQGLMHRLPAPGQPFALDLSFSPMTDGDLRQLHNFPSIVWLDLRGTQVTDVGLQELACLPLLHTLFLNASQTTPLGLKTLRENRQLHAFTNSWVACRQGRTGPQPIAELYLEVTSLNDHELQLLRDAGLRQLKTLDLDEATASDVALRALQEVGLLHALMNARSFDGSRPTGVHDIAMLNLSNTRVSHLGLEALAELDQLQTLYLDHTALVDRAVAPLAHLVSLKTLNLWGNPVTDAGLKQVARLPQLEALCLSQTRVTSNGLQGLARLPRLRLLELERSCLTDDTLQALQDCGRLQVLAVAVSESGGRPSGPDEIVRLNLAHTPVTERGLATLAELPQLRMLDLRGTLIPEAALRHWQQQKTQWTIIR